MNPLTNVKNINKINEIELAKGTVDKKSWHDIYKGSAWIFIGGLAYGMTEGDIICVFSQCGEIVNINLVRDQKTGKIKGFCFLCYANQKSTILAVDNLNGIKLCGRTIRVDHVANYKPPKDNERDDEITKQLKAEGCAPKPLKIENSTETKQTSKKHKKEKKKHKKKRKRENQEEFSLKKVKKEKFDPSYLKYEFPEVSNKIKRSNSVNSESSSGESSDSESKYLLRKEKRRSESRPDSDRAQPSCSQVPVERENSKKYDKNHMKRNDSERKRFKDFCSDSESDTGKSTKFHSDRNHVNGSSFRKIDLKSAEYNRGRSRSSSSTDERYKKRKSSYKNVHNDSSDYLRNKHKRQDSRLQLHDSSSNDESYSLSREKGNSSNKERERYERGESSEKEDSYHRKKRLESNHYAEHRDHVKKDSTYKKKEQYYNERRDSREIHGRDKRKYSKDRYNRERK